MSLPLLTGKHLFFTGKGGAGKTTVACSLAAQYAGVGERVLLVSTDPASNIGQVYGREIGGQITALGDLISSAGDTVLDAIEIDPDAEAESYRESILGPVRGLLPADVLASTEESLSGSCTVEVASFNRFTEFLTSPEHQANYDRIIFDTAPTGHTLRLLSLPGDWSSFIDKGTGDASCLGPMSGLEKHRQTYAAAVDALADVESTSMVLVARAQESSIAEADRSAHELNQIGIPTDHLIVNGLLPVEAASDSLSEAIYGREQLVLKDIEESDRFPALKSVIISMLELKANPVMGIAGLMELGVKAETVPAIPVEPLGHHVDVPIGLAPLVAELAEGQPKVILCMGKGGVGKTTVAQAIAVELARMGRPVHLSTTDPAAHLDMSLADDLPSLKISAIDPDLVVAEYREEVLATKGAALDADGYAQLEEDLRSPCTEEVAVFRAFSSVIKDSDTHWVVLDTAPTGHTLLLLDATGSYHRELVRQSGESSSDTTLTRLQNAEVTKPILVTLPETTPVLEAQELARDLERAGIAPWAWVVNQSIVATQTQSPFLQARAAAQSASLAQVVAQAGARVVQTPVTVDEPCGQEGLATLVAPPNRTAIIS